MDYWKNVPGIDEKKDDGFLVALNTALTELAHAAVLSSDKAISKILISHKKAIEKEIQSKSSKNESKLSEAKNLLDDQRFVKAILQALEGADPQIISKVFTAFSKGDNATAGKLLGSIKKKDFS
jgi:hypothetical protein